MIEIRLTIPIISLLFDVLALEPISITPAFIGQV